MPEPDRRERNCRNQGKIVGHSASTKPLYIGQRRNNSSEHRHNQVSFILLEPVTPCARIWHAACFFEAVQKSLSCPKSDQNGDPPPLCSPLFLLRQTEAAKILGIAPCTLKDACRKLGLGRWPWRQQQISLHSCAAASAGPPPLLAPDNTAGSSRWERQNARCGGLLDEAMSMEL